MKLLLHPLPVRIFHWVMALTAGYLTVSGLYLHDPWAGPVYGMIRKIHMFAGMLLLVNLAGQIYYYVFTGKYPEVLFTVRDLPNLSSFFRYALFIAESHPNYGRYNPGQKALFSAWGIAVLLAGIAALPYLWTEQASLFSRLFGGMGGTRLVFYVIAWFFVATIPLHLYLALTEDPAKLQAMFSGYVRKQPRKS